MTKEEWKKKFWEIHQEWLRVRDGIWQDPNKSEIAYHLYERLKEHIEEL